jgi:hypothetical protein
MYRQPGERSTESGPVDPREALERRADEGKRRKEEAKDTGLADWDPPGAPASGGRRLLRAFLMSRALLGVLLVLDVLLLSALRAGIHETIWVGVPIVLLTLTVTGFQRDAGRPLPTAPVWLSRAPFPIHFYPVLLASLPDTDCVVVMRVVLEPRSPGPRHGLVSDLVGTVDPASRAPHKEPFDAVVRSGSIRCVAEAGEAPGVNVARWVQEVVEQVLVPLHAVHPIKGVFLSRDDDG